MDVASTDFEGTAKAAAIITPMAANFEHMWFISLRRPSLPRNASDSCPYIRSCKPARLRTHSAIRGPVSGAITRRDAASDQPKFIACSELFRSDRFEFLEMRKIRIAIVGVGNCASSLVQGINFYDGSSRNGAAVGLMHRQIGGYRPSDVEVVAAFDIDRRKAGLDVSRAIFSPPNFTKVFCEQIN